MATQLSKLPKTEDLSFDFDGTKVVFNYLKFEGKQLITISSIGKIGNVIEVYFPLRLELGSSSNKRKFLDYETKELFGGNSEYFDFMIRNLAKAFHSKGLKENFVLYIGLHKVSEQFAVKIGEVFESHLNGTLPPGN